MKMNKQEIAEMKELINSSIDRITADTKAIKARLTFLYEIAFMAGILSQQDKEIKKLQEKLQVKQTKK